MLILALETSTDSASCALWSDGQVLERRVPAGLASSGEILPAVSALLAEAGMSLQAVDAVAFGAGPGSFTGLRIACGLAQGFGFALGIPLVPVGTLDAIAETSGENDVLATLDARMGEVYFARFRRAKDDWAAIGEAAVAAPGDVPLPLPGTVVAGNALIAYPDLAERLRATCPLRSEIVPGAAAVAVLGARRLCAGGGIDAAAAVPLYVRDKVAQTVVERLAAGGRA